MKSVLISIQPIWTKKITHIIGQQGNSPIFEKSLEIRKTRPKINTPFKCYIYETKSPKLKYVWTKKDYEGYPWFEDMDKNEKTFCKLPQGRGKVIGEFVCDEITEFSPTMELKHLTSIHIQMVDKSCVNMADLFKYANGKSLCGWHISNLVIYDKPKELSEFYTKCKMNCEHCEQWGYTRVNAEEFDMDCKSDWFNHKPIKRPPQSWCYVAEQ